MLDLSTSLVPLYPGSKCGHGECVTEDLPVNHVGLAVSQGAQSGTGLHSLAAARSLSGRGHPFSHSPHCWKFILIQNENQMYRALGVGYEIVLRLKTKRKSDVFI